MLSHHLNTFEEYDIMMSLSKLWNLLMKLESKMSKIVLQLVDKNKFVFTIRDVFFFFCQSHT